MTPLQLEAEVLLILIKGLALSVALFALALVLLRGRSAHTSSLVWRATMLGLLAIPAISLWIPWLKVAPPAPRASSPPATIESVALPPSVSPNAATTVTGPSLEAASPNEVALPEFAPSPPADTQPAPPLSLMHAWRPHLVTGLWLAGVLAVMGRWLWSWCRVRGLVRRAVEDQNAEWKEEISRLGVDGQGVRLMVSREVQGPMVCGLLRPVIVVPPDAREWPGDHRRQILAHELSHIRRSDPAWLLVARIAVALHWLNPLAWLAAKRLRLADEQCADDAVLQAGGDPAEYASLLTSFARSSMTTPHCHPAVAPSVAGASTLRSRVQRVLDRQQRRGAPRRTTQIALASLVVGVVAIAGGLSPTPAGAQETGDPGVEPADRSWPTILPGSENTLLKARKILIPSIDFEEVTIQDMVDYLRQRSRELDTIEPDPAKKGLNFVVLGAETAPLRVRGFRLRDVPITTVLEYACRQTGTTFEVGPHGLTVMERRASGRSERAEAEEPGPDPAEWNGPTILEGSDANLLKARSILIPGIDFERTSIDDAIDYLRQRSRELDTIEPDPAKKGLNFVVIDDGTAQLRVADLQLRNVPVATVLEFVCRQTGTTLEVGPHAFVIEGRGPINKATGRAEPPEDDQPKNAAAKRKEEGSEQPRDEEQAPPGPPWLEDLELVKLDSTTIRLRYTSDTCVGTPQPGDLYRFEQATVQDGKVVRARSEYLAPERNIFDDGVGANRFHFRSVERKEAHHPLTGALREVNIATIEDKSAKKAGRIYEIQKGSDVFVKDHVATFRVKTAEGGKREFTVVDNDTFTVGEDSPGEPVSCRFVEVDEDENVVVEYAGTRRRVPRIEAD